MNYTKLVISAYLLSTTMFQSSIGIDYNSLSNNDANYRLDERTARNIIQDEITNKFGTISSPWWLWPFISEAEKNKIRIKNQEIKEVKNLADREIESPDNYKRIVVKEPYIRYQTRTVRKPFKRVITEWREVTESVPYTDFRVERKKRWSKERLTSRFGSAILAYIEAKSYNYALHKTGNRVIADVVKNEISQQIIHNIKAPGHSLSDYIGKARDTKIEKIIRRINNQEIKREQQCITSSHDTESKSVANNVTTPSAPDWEDQLDTPVAPDDDLYAPSAPDLES